MRIINALTTVCDFLLGFTVAALFAPVSESWLLIGVILALGFLSSLILQTTKGGVAQRIICSLLPAFGLAVAKSIYEIIAAAIILSFAAVFTISGKSGDSYEDYRYRFGVPAVPVTAIFIICTTEWPVRPAASVCAAAYLFTGVLVLRRKRMGSGAGLKLRIANVTCLFAVAALSVLSLVLLYLLIANSKVVFETLLLPFGLLFSGISYLLEHFLNLFKPPVPISVETAEETTSETFEHIEVPETSSVAPRDDSGYLLAEQIISIIIFVLVLALIAFLLFCLYRFINNSRVGKKSDAVEEGAAQPARLGIRFPRKRQKKRVASKTNNEKIRSIYYDYLIYLKICGVDIARDTTSSDVLDASSESAYDDAKRMRELYIRARYKSGEECGDKDVEEAKRLLAEIRAKATDHLSSQKSITKTGS